MIGVLPTITIIKWVSTTYAVLIGVIVGLVTWASGEHVSGWKVATYALSGATALQAALFGVVIFGWKRLWKYFPKLNEWIYPDLSGTWSMEIFPGGQMDAIQATAFITQNILQIKMDVTAPNSSSTTLIAVAKKDSDLIRPDLYYVFVVTTRPQPDRPSKMYKGAAILNIDFEFRGEMTGNYWTSEEASGHYRLHNQLK